MIQTTHCPKNAVIGDTSNVLKDIHLKDKNIAIYQRDINHLSPELKNLCQRDISFKSNGSVKDITSSFETFSKNRLPAYSLLFQDIHEILRLFQNISKANTFKLSLESISTDMCRKFHADYNQLRLLCTYVGSGTLWLPDDAQKDAFLKDDIQKVKTGNIALLKGKLYPNAKPLFHRSPEIETLNEKRLLLKIDGS